MAFHDTIYWPGPKKVVARNVYKSKFFRNVKFIHTITYGQKVEKNFLKNRIKNRYTLLLKNVYEIIFRLYFPFYRKRYVS